MPHKGFSVTALVVILGFLLSSFFPFIFPVWGITWSTGQSLIPSLAIEAKPYVIEDNQGILWAVYESSRSANWDIYSRRFDGSSWLPEERLTDHGSSDLNPAIAQLANGTILLVWTSNRSGEFSLYYKTLSSGSWSAENTLTLGPGKDSTPALLQARNGTLWVFWTRETLQGQVLNRDVLFKTYSNAAWSSEQMLANSTAHEWQPSVFEAFDGTIWAVYSSKKPGNFDLYYRKYTGDWGPETPLTTNTDDDRQPWITQDNNGTLWAIWARCVGGATCQDDVFYKTSTNLGSSWSPEVRFTVDPQGVEVFDTEPAAVHAKNRRIYLFWMTSAPGDGGNFDIYYSTSDPVLYHDLAANPPSMQQYKPRQGEMFNTTVRVQNNGDFAENAALTVTIDASVIGSTTTLLQPGQTAAFTYNWDASGKALGPHQLQVSVANAQGEAKTWNNQVSRTLYVLSSGDVLRDGPVDVRDLAAIGLSFTLKAGDPPFNPDTDLNRDGRIDIVDLARVGMAFTELVVLPPDFDLVSNIYYLRLVRGFSATATITIRTINGLRSPIALGATTTSQGVTASLSPNVVLPPATSILTLTASSTAAIGNFTVTITATNQTVSKSIYLSLEVTPADFNLSASPTSITIIQGTSGSVTITVTSVGGFDQAVTLTTTGLPSGVTGTYTVNPVIPPAGGTATSTLSLSTSTTATAGTFTVTVTGTSSGGALVKTTTFSLEISRRTTSTSVACSPATTIVNQQTTCTATVTDTSSGTVITPSGIVTFTSTGTGTFSAPSCNLSGTGATASCSVNYTPTAVGTGTHTITATYAGDPAHTTSSGSTAVTVNKRSTSTTISCTPTTTVVNQATTCTATVTDTSTDTLITPSGTVTFASSSTGSFSAMSCTLAGTGVSASCQVSYTPTAVGTGTHTITGAYTGDLAHNGSSGTAGVTVNKRATTTTVNCDPATVVMNQPATCTATVTDTSPGTAVTPTGTVSFTSTGTGTFSGASCTLAGAGAISSCPVTYTPTAVGTGTHTITSTYGGGATHNGSSGTFALTVNKRNTTTAVTCVPATVVVNQATTCTATVTDTSIGTVITPTGTVGFTSTGAGTFSVASCTLTGTGASASCSVNYTPTAVGTGTHTITSNYGGDATHTTSSANQGVTVNKRTTSTIVSCTPSTVVVNQATTCTATVTDTATTGVTTPTGTVSFTSSGTGTFTGSSCTLSGTGASASCSVNYTPTIIGTGTHAITGNYGGDATHVAGSGSGNVTVNLRNTSTSVGCVPSSVVVNQAVACTVTVTDTSAGTAITPTSTVSLISSGTGTFSATSCTLSGTGASASCSVNYTPTAIGTGTQTITGAYSGDTAHSSSSGTFNVTVNKRATSTTLTCTPATVVLNEQTVCTATVTDISTGTTMIPSGTVTFSSTATGTFSATSCTLAGTGASASCSISYTPTMTGTHTISASHTGDANHTGSAGSFSLTLFDFTLTISPGSGTLFQAGELPATVTATLVSGETRPVNFATSGLPGGVTAEFAPSSCSPNCSSTATFKATGTATVGNYTVTVIGTTTTGGLSHTTSITLFLRPKPEFTISASPGTLVIRQGGSPGMVTVTVTYLGLPGDVNLDGTVNVVDLAAVGLAFTTVSGDPGYNAQADLNKDGIINVMDLQIVGANFGATTVVALSTSGLPSGVTASFSPSSLSPGGTSTLSLTASSTASTGSFTVTIRGTSARATESTTVQLIVRPPPDYTISASPTSLSIARGKSGTVTVTVTSLNDFSSPVTLSISGLPSGVTATFAPNPVTPEANGSVTSTLTLSASSAATRGTFTVTITGTSGGLVHTTTITLTITR